MTIRRTARALALLAAAALPLALSACSTDTPALGGSTGDRGGQSQPGQNDSGTSEGTSEGTGESTTAQTPHEIAIIAIETALADKNATAEWQGSTFRVNLDGSAADPTSWLWCTAAEALIAESESAVMVYSDGELHCDERPGY